MMENEFSTPGKILVEAFLALMLPAALILVIQNAADGVIPHPWAAIMIALGFLCFLIPKLMVVRRQAWISFGTRFMSVDQANSYRVGYWLMGVGVLMTFLPWQL